MLTVRSQPINASEAERQVFLTGHASTQQGYGGMYNQYEEYLTTL